MFFQLLAVFFVFLVPNANIILIKMQIFDNPTVHNLEIII